MKGAPVKDVVKKLKQHPNKPLVIALVLGLAYLAYSALYWLSMTFGLGSGLGQIGSAFITALLMPHWVATIAAVSCNGLAVVRNNRTLVLAGGILYAVAVLLFPLYFYFVTAQAVLSFVAFARMGGTAQG